MITDPEELLSKMFRAVREIGYTSYPLRLTEESYDACIDLIKQYEIRIRAESAEQARKEAAERVACAWREHGENITLRKIRDAILDDSTTDHIPDAVEKLAIAVKALENISGRGMTGGVIAKRALKKIQQRAKFLAQIEVEVNKNDGKKATKL